ncbi:MAG TPA: WG repeat-containing protein [Bacillota bacterium]|nr:WG repeat-containing protein [Bacillota bacterium]
MKKTKKLCFFLAIAVLTCTPAINADAMTKGQNAIGDIGAKITWFDFGKAYNYYQMQDDMETGLYALTMSNDSTGVVKTGYVNGKGEIVIEPDVEESSDYGSEGDKTVFTAHRGNSLLYGDVNGLNTVDVSAFSDIETFHDGYAVATVKASEKKAVIDKNGSLLFEDKAGKYIRFDYLGSGLFAAEIGATESTAATGTTGTAGASGIAEATEYDVLDRTGTLLSKAPYTNDWLWTVSEERLRVGRDGKYGFLDLSGNEIIPLVYDDAFSFHEGLAAVCKDGKWGFIDKNGGEAIAPVYDQVDSSFSNGMASASLNGKWGLIDKAGNTVVPFEYDNHIYRSEGGYFLAEKDGKNYPLDASGKPVSGEYTDMSQEADGRIYVSKDINGSNVSAYLDQNRTMLTGFKEFTLYPLSDELYLGEKSGDYPPGVVPPHDYSQKVAILDSEGNRLTGFNYGNVRWSGGFWNGFQVVTRDYYGKAGLVNRNGAEVLPTMFQDIILTRDGYAFVTVADPDTGGNCRVGYFKIPDQFNEIKGARPVTVYLDGVELYFDSEPVIKDQRTMVPMRKIFESLGAEVQWDESAKTVTAKSAEQTIKLTIGSKTASVNGSEVQLDAAPFIQSDRTLVPLRFVSEHLGAGVQWDDLHRRVIITDGGDQK